MDLLGALVLMVVLSLTPTVLFVLFWRFLESLRDDALIERLHREYDIEPSVNLDSPLSTGRDAGSSPALVTCSNCGVRTVPDRGACALCGHRFDS